MPKTLLDNYKIWLLARQISLISSKNEMTITQLSHELDINPQHPYFRRLIRYLDSTGGVYLSRMVGNIRLIKINKSRVCKNLEAAQPYMRFKEYVEKNKIWSQGV